MTRNIKSSMETKEKLHLLALNAYLKEGAHNTTFQSLANQLGISQAAIYKHYKSKDDLLVGSIQYAADKGREYILKKEDPKLESLKKLQLYIKRNLDFCTEVPIYSVAVITLHYFAICIPKVKELHEEINRSRIEKISEYLFQSIKEKSIHKDLDVKEISYQIHSLLMGEMIKTFIWPKKQTVNTRIKKLWPTIEKLLK
jgi:AcrR family transcriptional regulator